MLTGEVEHQLDDRGRVVVPRAWREDLEHGGFITRGWYGCLWLFTWEAWRDLLEKLKTVKLTDTAGDRLKQFLGRGEKVFLDAQGRLLLSPSSANSPASRATSSSPAPSIELRFGRNSVPSRSSRTASPPSRCSTWLRRRKSWASRALP